MYVCVCVILYMIDDVIIMSSLLTKVSMQSDVTKVYAYLLLHYTFILHYLFISSWTYLITLVNSTLHSLAISSSLLLLFFFYLILFINSDLFHKQILLVNDVVVYKYIIIMNKIRKISLVYVARLLHNPKIIMVTCTYVRTIVLYHFIPVSKHAPTCVWMFHLVDWLYKNRYYNQMYDFCLCRIIYHNDTCIRCVAVIKWTTINSTQHMLYFV